MAMLKTKVKNGWVEGLPSDSPQISIFKGIPFAAPPVGELRWRPPQPAADWDGVYKAYTFSKIPMQRITAREGDGSLADYEMSEDCLYLNVWTPAKTADEKLPVAVYIYGGAFAGGYSHRYYIDGDAYATRGIVFVTFEYRVNSFGYLAHPDLSAENESKSSGNFASLDQVAALKWVHENIAAFGGDPECVTVFGQSAGAGSTLQMSLSPLTKGLLKRAITQSGGGMQCIDTYWHSSLKMAEELGVRFFNFLGVKTVEEARALPADFVLQKTTEFSRVKFDDIPEGAEHMRGPMGAIRFRSIIDGYVTPDQQYLMCQRNEHHKIDYMMGATRDEDGPRLYSTLAFAKNELMLGNKPTYLYLFSRVPPTDKDAHHGAELEYMFYTQRRCTKPWTGRDYELSVEMVDRWAAFIKTGSPNPEGYPEWTPFTEDKPEAYDFGDVCSMHEIEETPFIKEQVEKMLKRPE